MKFRYKNYGSQILRPVIPIELTYNDRTVPYDVLIDSGSDICIFHSNIGDLLGIDLTSGRPEEVFGVGGKVSIYYLHRISIMVGGWPFEIDAGFMPNVSGSVVPYGILGQKGFFEHFVVKFDLSKEEIELRRKE